MLLGHNHPEDAPFRRSWRAAAALILVFSVGAVGLSPCEVHAAKAGQSKQDKREPREMQAREAYAAGDYKGALDIYTKLYAEKLHPTYLRNIGRCYQNLNEPARAISSFREYLRKGKDIPTDERTEIEGYIREMEDLQKRQAAAARPAPAPAPVPVPVPTPAPAPQPTVLITEPAPTPSPAPEPTPFYKKAWFWGVVGGVVVAGTVGGLWAGGAFSSKHNACPNDFNCGP
jgi:hypothetical protein